MTYYDLVLILCTILSYLERLICPHFFLFLFCFIFSQSFPSAPDYTNNQYTSFSLPYLLLRYLILHSLINSSSVPHLFNTFPCIFFLSFILFVFYSILIMNPTDSQNLFNTLFSIDEEHNDDDVGHMVLNSMYSSLNYDNICKYHDLINQQSP